MRGGRYCRFFYSMQHFFSHLHIFSKRHKFRYIYIFNSINFFMTPLHRSVTCENALGCIKSHSVYERLELEYLLHLHKASFAHLRLRCIKLTNQLPGANCSCFTHFIRFTHIEFLLADTYTR